MKSGHPPSKFRADKLQFTHGVITVLLVMCVGLPSIWHCVKLGYDGIGIRIQHLWEKALDWVGDDTFNLYVYGLNGWNIVLYWTVGLALLFMEMSAWPKWLIRYKIQPTVTVDRKRFTSLIALNLFNQFFVAVPFSLFGYYYIKTFPASVPPIRELPTSTRLVVDLAIIIPLQEIFAYYAHRIFHHRLLYKWTHKVHHEWTAPIALTASYNHPLDHLIVNILPTTVGLFLTNAHFFTTWIWLTWATLRALSDHSGYNVLTFLLPRRHDFHHQKFTDCFGVWGPLDYLHDTEKLFQANLASLKAKKKSD
ncbi:fatty acid hydroxylase domain-containing protein 2-like [Daphnia pulex]|uniref:fatty acid hydroxylase domain-containing protein 2-like n=1 Tax=Daphnia pulex TaxID=6669 RepID=UPI001EDDA4D1|nr:fatty acid hydroxylase domain-containing protein 2-like [Daphnia pulex]